MRKSEICILIGAVILFSALWIGCFAVFHVPGWAQIPTAATTLCGMYVGSRVVKDGAEMWRKGE